MKLALGDLKRRLERLERGRNTSVTELEARISRMSDGELEARQMLNAERLLGQRALAFASGAAFARAVQQEFGPDIPCDEERFQAHWEREHWLTVHSTHALVVVVPQLCVQPPYGYWGPGVVMACRCGARLSMLHELVPEWASSLSRFEVERESDFRAPWDV